MLPAPFLRIIFGMSLLTTTTSTLFGQSLELTLRYRAQPTPEQPFEELVRSESWQPRETAIIVCDVWDLHHCFNAVERIKEFAPRLNALLNEARQRGVTIIHSPSDCMPQYIDHPARVRAVETPAVERKRFDVETWCSQIASEATGVWPIDQSDGGEDDEPEQHARWATHLRDLGRNPGMPWKTQTDLLPIDAEQDFISDRGDEVWNILEARGIKNVILTGVHTNMCVIGRPFGLRQLARNGKNVVLMRDMTDTMYNPARWPYVSHFTGTDLILAYIERHVCPTITSDQILGGAAFRFSQDGRAKPMSLDGGDLADAAFVNAFLAGDTTPEAVRRGPNHDHWATVQLPGTPDLAADTVWFRCAVKIPSPWTSELSFSFDAHGRSVQAWLNGIGLTEFSSEGPKVVFKAAADHVQVDDANLLVYRVVRKGQGVQPIGPLEMNSAAGRLSLEGAWQMRTGDDPSFSNIPLPAKFGTSADIVFAPTEPNWVARPHTRMGGFTAGIEGPACDREGNVYAVNWGAEGTIGQVTPASWEGVFVRLPEGSVGNGIRFDKAGRNFFVADYTKHNVLCVNLQTRQVSVVGHNGAMNQPNDLAIAPDGTLYASDPNWANSTGQIWRVEADGQIVKVADEMGTTNGIEVSPDGMRLYVNESVQRNIWVFDIDAQHSLTNKRLLKQFPDFGFDGMRCDVDGNLYVTRYGKGTVVKLSPGGEILQEIDVLGARPSNLCFGGPDGCTVYVTEVEFQRLVRFRVDRPGRSWSEWITP